MCLILERENQGLKPKGGTRELLNMNGVGVSQRIYASTTCRSLRHLKVEEVKIHWKKEFCTEIQHFKKNK